MTRGHKGLVRK